MIILTLVTYILLSVSVLHSPLLSWRTVRHPTAHHQTLGIILATLVLKRYHIIWITSGPLLLHTVPSSQSTSTPLTLLNLSLSPGLVSRYTALPPHANPRKRKHHSPPPTPEEDDDNGQVRVDDTETIPGNIDDVAEKGDALSTSHL